MSVRATEPDLYRSEAFSEDLLDLVSVAPPVVEPQRRHARWLVLALPVAVALIGVAFALVPPLN